MDRGRKIADGTVAELIDARHPGRRLEARGGLPAGDGPRRGAGRAVIRGQPLHHRVHGEEPRAPVAAAAARAALHARAAAAGARTCISRTFARFSGGAARRAGGRFLTSLQPAGCALVGLWILVMAAAAWLLPFDSGLLDFSDAETAILFPAPVTRRQLLIHRLLRSQIGLALAGIIPALHHPVRLRLRPRAVRDRDLADGRRRQAGLRPASR